MANFQGDEHEPQAILRLIDQAKELEVCALNAAGWADYKWSGVKCFCHDSDVYQVERKTWDDLTNGIEEIEEQLANQMRLHPDVHHRLLIEGVVEPAPQGLLVYRQAQGKNVMSAGLRGERGSRYKSIVAWLAQVKKYWDLHYTHTMSGTAILLTALYDGDQEEEDQHTTFKRMFKHLDYSINPQAQIIMGASGKVHFGPKTAEAVAKRFGTAYRAFKAPLSEWLEIPGVGPVIATQYLRGLGRPDV